MTSEIQNLNDYIYFLEKTNQQLSLWYNPYGLMVGIVTLLVALIAMGVAYALWKNSKEQKDRATQFFNDQEEIIKEKNENVKKMEEKFGDLIKEYEEQLKGATKGKEKIQKIINELKREQARIGSYMGPVAVSTTISGMEQPFGAFGIYRSKKFMNCIKCGRKFSYYDEGNPYINVHTFTTETVYCPFCGAKNISQNNLSGLGY